VRNADVSAVARNPWIDENAGTGSNAKKENKATTTYEGMTTNMKQMTLNRWTFALAACGVVSLASVARADEKPSPVQTALSNTTISGYVSASANVGLTGGYASSPAASIPFQAPTKQNGFNLDVIKLSISKPEDATPWASGYDVDLLFGPDAVGYNTTASTPGHTVSLADYAIKQAYVTLNTPIGNGIDWKVGVFDSPLGYEVYDSGSNPNYTRSWGYDLEPTELTGLQASYKINDQFSVSAGVVNTSSAGVDQRNTYPADVWHKAYFGDVTYTAPSSLGWVGGSTFFAGVLYGSVDTTYNTEEYQAGNQINYYGGLTLNTPWKALTGGVAFDYVQNYAGGVEFAGFYSSANVVAVGLYGNYKATDKLSLNARGEYVEGDNATDGKYSGSANIVELTGTVEYDLWANVETRAEVRWDQQLRGAGDGTYFFTSTERTDVGLYANVIYKF
jgi:hypothetical protein